MNDDSDLILVSGDSAKIGDDYDEWIIKNAVTEWTLKGNNPTRLNFKDFVQK